MTTEAVYFKEHEGIMHNSAGQLSSPLAPGLWWGAGYGAQSFQSNSSQLERTGCGDHFAASKQAEQGTKQSADKGSVTQSIFSGDGLKSHAALPEYCSRFEPGFSQPMICAKYPYVDPCYGVLSAHGPQLSGRIMLPLDLGTNDVPIFVNPKQYHAIMKSRERRAKAELKNKQNRVRKPYMHESRHLHAMRRPRGCGGRFLNTKNLPSCKGEADLEKDFKPPERPTGSQGSEVLQSDSGTLSSPRGANGSITSLSGSTEVTSNTYAREDLGRLSMNFLRPPLHFLPLNGMIDTGHSIVKPSTWVTAADDCRDL
ncbi:nuclear transcription factor Y subunit A-10-like [Punica granatum]|uniref:Nuclear transcription factor Y subunit n=2 Tax=Punica granatum TaxID=22663 RepID=A0A218XBJ8_PUNGR|nr:nuclear transcription factor Y subunit A-10-like [Punica granatum]XP_031399054.1 nuclear transcription factor Y subunit A-10-like [Punica granatum]OWM82595.1 hypothetical protein CDL15_Pgr002170 [Punica granatum]PKI35300.1 hypothetical protein CRG98_044314 [Punica granatum]